MPDDDPRDEVDTLRSRIKSGERPVSFAPDRDHLLRMSKNIRLVPSEIGEHRHLKILRHTHRMAQLVPWPEVDDFVENDEAEEYGVATEDDVGKLLEEHGLLGLSLESRAAAEAIVRWIHEEYSNEHTNQDYRTALRSFGRYRLKQEDPPDSLDWIPTGTSNDFDPAPSERDLLTFDEVQDLIDAAQNPRDKALFALQFESGLRGGELWNLRVGDIFDSEYAVGIHSDGKKGEKPVHLIWAVSWVQKWLQEHPGRDDPDAYLWTKLSTAERPSRQTFYGYFSGAADRAGIAKDVTPTNFRKANTRWLITIGMSTPRIEDRQGRKRGSEHTARYLARFGDESNEKAYARLHDIDVGDDVEEKEIGPIICDRCDRETPRTEDYCVWCDFGLSYDAAEDAKAAEDETAESIAASADPDLDDLTPEEILEARDEIQGNDTLKRIFSSVL